MIIKQISIFVENKRGRLAEITKVLQDNAIDIRALCIADTKDFGILRIIVDNPNKAVEVLKEDGFTVSLTKVIGIGIDDTPGGLHKAMAELDKEEISVEYMYAFLSRCEKTAYVILRVEDNEKAIEVLMGKGFKIMSSSEI
ncbi:MAG: acetolactate synthase [Oscillospiraceae bacterium]